MTYSIHAAGADHSAEWKHRVGKARILAAMASADHEVTVGDAVVFVGRDDRGVELEIVAVPDDRNPGGLAVIHAMPTACRRK